MDASIPHGVPPAGARRAHRLTVISRHADGTLCGHRHTPSGKPRDEGCPGRAGYSATCACGWTMTGEVKAAIEYSHTLHRSQTRTAGGGDA